MKLSEYEIASHRSVVENYGNHFIVKSYIDGKFIQSNKCFSLEQAENLAEDFVLLSPKAATKQQFLNEGIYNGEQKIK